ncbi:hypothetical protein [Thalassotalea sp. PS06]|uniref:hypothetical protein n=1 Tax=Thalassotalea sp. PS06 TaxID=2594005 RepID=UPI001165A8DE|nr:hypothetical protein [Thalassotalea sp. PS06]QDP02572.1 hypothetical protein FNC98_15190 [Thalassotalea sp. PS06]
MDLILANLIVIFFYVVFITIVEKSNVISAKENTLKAIGIVGMVLLTLLVSSVLFALLIGWLLPEFYPKVFFYKALFVCMFLFIYWPCKMFNAHVKA